MAQTPGKGSIPRKANVATADRILKKRRPFAGGYFGHAAEVPYSSSSAAAAGSRQRGYTSPMTTTAKGGDGGDSDGFSDDDDDGSSKTQTQTQSKSESKDSEREHAVTNTFPDSINPYTFTQQQQQQSILSRVFTFIETHPTVPGILSYYAQFLFNAFLALLALYVIVSFLLAIRSEVNRASEELSAEILNEMTVCARDYVENRCAENSGGVRGKRLPYLEAVCDKWERCMNRDPAKVGRATLSAKTLAEIFNGFIEPISYKAFVS